MAGLLQKQTWRLQERTQILFSFRKAIEKYIVRRTAGLGGIRLRNPRNRRGSNKQCCPGSEITAMRWQFVLTPIVTIAGVFFVLQLQAVLKTLKGEGIKMKRLDLLRTWGGGQFFARHSFEGQGNTDCYYKQMFHGIKFDLLQPFAPHECYRIRKKAVSIRRNRR